MRFLPSVWRSRLISGLVLTMLSIIGVSGVLLVAYGGHAHPV